MLKIPSIFLFVVISTSNLSQAFLAPALASAPLFATRQLRAGSQDTPETLPDFKTAEDYLKYMETVSALPKGFATGTADGTFVSVEAPSLGNLKIRGTIIHVTSGPTENWAACFTSNKVRCALPSNTILSQPPWRGRLPILLTFSCRFYIVPWISSQSWKKAIGDWWSHSSYCHQQ